MANATVILAIATLAIGIVSVIQWQEVKESDEWQLRGYVFIRILAGGHPHGNTVDGVQYALYNPGKTPAKKIGVSFAVDILPYPLPKDYKIHLPPLNNLDVFMAPGDVEPGGFIKPARKFTSDEVTKAGSGDGYRVYFLGVITYRDVFNMKRGTDFCLSLVPSASDQNGRVTWAATEGHNDFH